MRQEIRNVAISTAAEYSRRANDIEYVKHLLGDKKEDVIMKLIVLIPLSRYSNSELKNTYMKILPVFLSYAEIFGGQLKQAILLIKIVQKHFPKERSLFDGWYIRFTELRNRIMVTNDGQAMKKKIMNYNNNVSNRFQFINGTQLFDTIGYNELDYFNSFHKYLKYHKLHKYLYFFANLSYHEIISINSVNIFELEEKVNIFPMTTGARNAILRKLTDLNLRTNRLMSFSQPGFFLSPLNVERTIEELKVILRTPIRSNTICQESNSLSGLLVQTLELLTIAVTEGFRDRFMARNCSDLILLLRKAWSCQCFTETQKALFNELRYKVVAVSQKGNEWRKPYWPVKSTEMSTSFLDLKELAKHLTKIQLI